MSRREWREAFRDGAPDLHHVMTPLENAVFHVCVWSSVAISVLGMAHIYDGSAFAPRILMSLLIAAVFLVRFWGLDFFRKDGP